MSIHFNMCPIMSIHLNMCPIMSIHLNMRPTMSIHLNICPIMSIHLCMCSIVSIHLCLCSIRLEHAQSDVNRLLGINSHHLFPNQPRGCDKCGCGSYPFTAGNTLPPGIGLKASSGSLVSLPTNRSCF